ncbi:hypothetical protein SAMN02990966_01145 [Rhodospirillales bacterium URHD0017]|nr:hypothetical protein SAMN02990966_01145 [Rhodospirillales bacterium URHD0017]
MTTQGGESPPPQLKGQPLSAITARLGPADSQEQIDGRTAYVWNVQTRAPATPVPSTRVSYPTGRPNTIETLSYPDPPRQESCTLRAFVDGAGNVTSTDWQGSNAGCYDAQQRLAGRG